MANLIRAIAMRPLYALSNSIGVGRGSSRASINPEISSASSLFMFFAISPSYKDSGGSQTSVDDT
jgi:hypothetical protein